MSKQLIEVEGEEIMVREDVAKAHRGVNWMVVVLAAIVLIVGVTAAIFLITGAMDGEVQSPAEIEGSGRR